ncbi:MAG: Z1 domain-containing protein [Actinobacteria bacterium]|jgi:hypothetical protein|nr:Z1 domain-containing protein [Actinomycetota bacterium]MBU1609667.1 Z1 domain-containing protein [Actinomycetota bacterium]MBU2314850.1 Z1 domain-containing protein [Actinomycetota bacterium]MBU2385210.1 Z1 domain-containing protein [Actinomycetota bacterium]
MALNDRQLSLKRSLKQQLIEGNATVDFVELSKLAGQLVGLLFKDLSKSDVDEVVSELTKEEEIVLAGGGTVYDPRTFKKWLGNRRGEVPHTRWKAYEQLLVSRDWAKSVIDDLAVQTDEVVELLGDPSDPKDMARRGLLLGEVQSGKTATYIGILNKAIDYGYRLIIVIGGHTNELRRQTQVRMDSDLIGYDTSRIGENISTSALDPIGVAEFDRSIRANVLTTVDGDFNVAKTRAGLNWIQDVLPTVLVIKKNAKVIHNVTNYIKQQTNGGRLDMPLVLIDDEADWGTPNTGSDTDPTRVNAAIRGLLDTSRRSSYLGITATPFANIFIDHAAENEELGQDLFPADYIRVMSSPSNYQGIGNYFTGEHRAIRVEVEDCIQILPIRHKKTHPVEELPESLERAVMTFYLGTAIRLLRTQGQVSPASMLVNVSRFNDVQAKISELVQLFALSLNGLVVAALAREEDRPHSSFATRLHEVWNDEFDDLPEDESWDEVVPWLQQVAKTIRVELVNSVTGAERAKRRRSMTAEQRATEDSRPTIFVGGDVLARGLTLSGLQVSYFVREPRTMDTLMQMGRWFGYRPGYTDLVRIWMPESTEADFMWSAEVAKELRDLLIDMRAKELTPRDFGLRVRAHPGGFGIVAANKRQSAELASGEVLIHGNKFESYYLDARHEVRSQNRLAASELVEKLTASSRGEDSFAGYLSWRGVPLDLVEDFFTKFRADPRDPFFGFAPGQAMPQIASYLSEAEGAESWDVVLVHGSAAPADLAPGVKIASSLRNSLRLDGRTIEIGNRRVATATNLSGALTPDAKKTLDESLGANEKPTEQSVLQQIAHPMLLLYALTTAPDKETHRPHEVEAPSSDPLIAVVLAFPAIGVEEAADRIVTNRVQKFWVNTVWWNNMRGYLEDGDDIDSGDDE